MAAAAACATIVIVSQMDFGAVELLDRHSGIKALTTSANANESRGGEFAKVDDRDFVLLTSSPPTFREQFTFSSIPVALSVCVPHQLYLIHANKKYTLSAGLGWVAAQSNAAG